MKTPQLTRSAVAIALALQALAAQADDAPNDAQDGKEKLERIVVTGYNIKRTDAET